MNQTILFKVPGCASRRPLVVLEGIDLSTKFSTTLRMRLSRALSRTWQWTRFNCTPRRIVRALFSARISTAVAGGTIVAMYWHYISVDDALAAQQAVGLDCLCAMPWGIVWAIRASMPMPEEGGAK